MTVGKKMNWICGQHIVEIDADIRKLVKDRRGKAELQAFGMSQFRALESSCSTFPLQGGRMGVDTNVDRSRIGDENGYRRKGLVPTG